MADLDRTSSQPTEQLWEQLDAVRAGMLGIVGSVQHPQPMAPIVERDPARIWFFAKRDSDLVGAVGDGARAHFCIVGKDHDYHACIAGQIRQSSDRDVIDRLWSPVVAAWYAQGKDDPNLSLLELIPSDAAIWASVDSAAKFGWEIAKANLVGGEPNVGARTHVTFG